MATTPELHEEQIAAFRSRAWHQTAPAASVSGTTSEGNGNLAGDKTSAVPQSPSEPMAGESTMTPEAESLEAANREGDGFEADSDDSETGDSDKDDSDMDDSDMDDSERDDSDVDDAEGDDEDIDGEDIDDEDIDDEELHAFDGEPTEEASDGGESESAEPENKGDIAEGGGATPVGGSVAGPLVTLEAARNFLNQHGLILFGPRSLGAPAPSLVEATLGATKAVSTPAEAELARSLVVRLVAEGSAVPLNLLGGSGDVPDFIASTAAFSFVFTLRGDKGWKRAPETTGAVKVTTLALHVYEVLAERGALTVAEIVNEVGREITESAVTRSLSELWSSLRVIPAPQQGSGDTRWELTTARFLKAVKAGANAGQPTALSALISLYLGQVYLATEDEICAFLSPLTARSRVRDVLHGLSAGRQLSEAVLDGKTVLFLPESLPDFSSLEPARADSTGGGTAGAEGSARSRDAGSPESGKPIAERIRSFESPQGEGGRDRGLRGKPAAARPGAARPGSDRGGFRSGSSTEARRGTGSSDRGSRGGERPSRPFGERPSAGERPNAGAGDRPSFARPWDEERRERPARPPFSGGDSRPRRDEARPPRREGSSERPAFGNRERPGGDRPSFRREGGNGAPSFGRREGNDRPRPFRSSFSPGSAGAPRADGPPREPRGEGRPPRRDGSSGGAFPRRDDRGDRPFRPSGSRPSGPRPSRPAGSPDERKSFDRAPREGGSGGGRLFGGGSFRPREDRASGGQDRPGGRGFGDRPPFREGAGRPSSSDRPSRPFSDRPARPFGDRPARSFSDRPARSFSDRPARPFGDRPAREGEGQRNRPTGQGGDRGGFRGGDRPARPSGGAGFSRGPAGGSRGPGGAGRNAGSFNRGPGGFSRGPSGDPGAGPGGRPPGDRPARRKDAPGGDRPAPRPRPEDEA